MLVAPTESDDSLEIYSHIYLESYHGVLISLVCRNKGTKAWWGANFNCAIAHWLPGCPSKAMMKGFSSPVQAAAATVKCHQAR